MYSWTITIAEVIGERKNIFEMRVEKDNKVQYMKINRNYCFKQAMPDDCRAILVKNTIAIFKKAGFGEYVESTDPDNINLTTLMAMIVHYKDFVFSQAEVIAILDRIKLEIENAPISKDDTVTAPLTSRKFRKIIDPLEPAHEQSNPIIDGEEKDPKRGGDVFLSFLSHSPMKMS